jgi:hypothetical protein
MRLIVGVSDHWLLGNLPLDDSRILDRLNDSRSDFVHLSEVEVHDHQNRQCVANLPHVAVPKCKIQFAGNPSQEHEAPETRLNRFASKDTFEATTILGRYCVSGELHLPEFCGDDVHTLTHQLARFFPMTGASLIGAKAERISFPLLIANKEFVSCFHVGSNSQTDDHGGIFGNLKELAAGPR